MLAVGLLPVVNRSIEATNDNDNIINNENDISILERLNDLKNIELNIENISNN